MKTTVSTSTETSGIQTKGEYESTIAIEITTPGNNECQFSVYDHGAIFETGFPYRDNMRHGFSIDTVLMFVNI